MVIELEVNGERMPLIFDTGGHNSITAQLKEQWGLPSVGTKRVTDSNGTTSEMELVQVGELRVLDSDIAFKGYSFFVVEQDFFVCFGGAKGLIGSDLFQDCTIEINSRDQVIKVTRGSRLRSNDRQNAAFSRDIQGIPVISLHIGKSKAIDAIFDTGASRLLTIEQAQVDGLIESGLVHPVHRGRGGMSGGVHGLVERSEQLFLRVPEFYLGKQRFFNFQVSSSDPPLSLLGTEILQYGVVTIDYVRKLFRFDPYGDEPVHDTRTFWNVDLTVKDNKLVVSTVWDHAEGDVAVDDEVTHIDGIAIGSVDFCESITTGIPLLKDKTEVILTLKTPRGIKEVKIKN
jgi:hypothetical protein